jgi:hypothetical protein
LNNVHLGLLITLIGGIISGFAGFRTNPAIYEGENAAIPTANFDIRLDKFEIELYPSRSVCDWENILATFKNSQPRLNKTFAENEYTQTAYLKPI